MAPVVDLSLLKLGVRHTQVASFVLSLFFASVLTDTFQSVVGGLERQVQ